MKVLMYILLSMQPKTYMEGGYVWWKNISGFLVKSIYLMVSEISNVSNVCQVVDEELMSVLARL